MNSAIGGWLQQKDSVPTKSCLLHQSPRKTGASGIAMGVVDMLALPMVCHSQKCRGCKILPWMVAFSVLVGLLGAQANDLALLETGTAATPNDEAKEVDLSQIGGRGKDPMTELLHWAIQHSDPEKLKEVMKKYQDSNLTLKDVYGQEMLDSMFVDEGSVMTESIRTIADFSNTSLAEEDLVAAISRLQELVEQVDNAGNLHKMGGLAPLLELAEGSKRELGTRTLALWTLGIAVQNNLPVQNDLLSVRGMARLVAQLPQCNQAASTGGEEGMKYCVKLLYTISGLTRNSGEAQLAANSEGLFEWLLAEGLQHSSKAISKKVCGLLDTVLAQNSELSFMSSLPAHQDAIGNALLALVRGSDPQDADIDTIDTAEKAIRLINRLLSLRPMLFNMDFRDELAAAMGIASHRCELVYGRGDEICEGLNGLCKHADLVLAARAIGDEEL